MTFFMDVFLTCLLRSSQVLIAVFLLSLLILLFAFQIDHVLRFSYSFDCNSAKAFSSA